MNKLTKVGLTALAGSLAAVAGANAGSLSVSGGSDITWLSKTGNTTSAGDAMTGNPIGWKNNLTFSGSGELDNGISWTANAYNSDAQALTSSNITFDMGGMGKLLVDNGDIVVIGGIKIHNASNTKTKTPGLGDVPLIGNLFKGNTTKNKLEEMLIFLSPRVLD